MSGRKEKDKNRIKRNGKRGKCVKGKKKTKKKNKRKEKKGRMSGWKEKDNE